MRTDEQIINDINELIDEIRVYINRDGGDLAFEEYANGILTIRLLGACIGCNMVDGTYTNTVNEIIKTEIEEIKEVIVLQ